MKPSTPTSGLALQGAHHFTIVTCYPSALSLAMQLNWKDRLPLTFSHWITKKLKHDAIF